MNYKKIFILFLFVILEAAAAFAQEDNDTTKTKDDWGWDHHKFKFDLFSSEFKGMPTISLEYGFSKLSLNGFNETFGNPNLAEFKIGYTDIKSTDEENILKYKFHYFFLGNFSTKLAGSSSANKLATDMWRFGFGRSSGYGYKLGDGAIIPYHTYSFEWTRLKMLDTPANPAGKNMIALFNNSFRFGTSFDGGIKFKIIPNIMLDAGYQRSIVFPRHLFWKWAGSVIIEVAGQGAIDHFVDQVMDASPYAVPVVSFVLKNALSYGIYELRQEKMNWPFATAAPLAYNQFKFGLTFVF